jgi:PST family polysaccharide transporter
MGIGGGVEEEGLSMVRRLGRRARGLLRSSTLRNLFYLYAVQVANYLFPLFTLPYLARVLGPEALGKLALAQTLSLYLSMLLEYSLSLSAAREVSKWRHRPQVLRGILSGVLVARGLLLLPAGAMVLLALYLFPPLRGEAGLLGGSFLLALGTGLSPAWFFQGVERMGAVALMEFSVRFMATLGIFVLVRSPAEMAWPLYLQGLAALAVGLVGFLWMVSWVGFRPGLGEGWVWLRRGFGLFLSRLVASLYTTANVLLVGFFLPPGQVALYSNAERLTRSLTPMWEPFNKLFLPRFSYLLEKNPLEATKLARRVGVLTFLLGLVGAGGLTCAAPLLVQVLLGPGYEGTVPLVRILAWILPLVALSNFLGIQWMLAQRMDRPFNIIIFIAGLLNVSLGFLTVPRYGAVGMAWVVVLSEAWVTGAMVVYLWWKGRLPWRMHED